MQGNNIPIDLTGIPSLSFSVLKTFGDTLFMSGPSFSAVSGISTHSVLAVSLPDFQQILLAPNVGGAVTDLEYINNNLYISGSFKLFNQASYAAVMDATTLENTNNEMLTNGSVSVSTGDDQGGFFIAGVFDQVLGESCNGLAYIDSDGDAECIDIETNGNVHSLFVKGDTLFIGGDFTEVNGIDRTRFAAWSITNSTLLAWNPSFDSTVKDFALYGDNLLVGGSFSEIDGQPRTKIAGFSLITSSLLSFAPTIDGDVNTLHVHQNELFVGGGFSNVNSTTRGRLASFNMLTMDMTDWSPNANSSVYDITSSDNQIFVCGTFTKIGTITRNKLAAFAYGSSSPNSLTTNYSYYTNKVITMATDGDKLIIGGYFGTYDNGHIQVIDLATNQIISTPLANAEVRCIAHSGDKFFVGGDFKKIGGSPTSGLIGVDMTTGSFNGFNPTFSGTFHQLESYENFLYAGGAPGQVNGTNVGRLAIFDLSNGNVVNTNPYFTDFEYDYTRIAAMERHGDRIYIGLLSTNQANSYVPNRNNLLCLNANNNTLIDFDPSAYGNVNTISANDNGVFIGGDLIHLGGTKLDGFAAYDLPSGNFLADQLVISGWGGKISSLAVHNDLLIAGGNLIAAGGGNQRSLAAYNFQTQQEFYFTGVNPAGTVTDLEIYDDKLYFGGDGMGVSFKFVSSYDFNNNQFINLNLDLALTSGKIFDIAVDDSGIFVAHSHGNQEPSLQFVSAFEHGTGERIDDWAIDITGAPYTQINTISLQGDHLYIGGSTKLISNNRRGNLASINLSDGQPTAWKPMANNTVNTLLTRENGIYIGGSFTQVNTILGGKYLSRLDKSTGAVNGNYTNWIKNEVYDLAYNPDDQHVYISGNFKISDGSARDYLIAWSEITNHLVSGWNAGPLQRPVHLTYHDNALWTQEYHPYSTECQSCYVRKLLPSGAFSSDSIPVFGNYVKAMAFQDDKMFLGGNFKGAGGILRNNILEIDAATGELTDFNPDIPFDQIVKVVLEDDKLVIMGKVSNKYRVMAIDVNTYEVLPEYYDEASSTDYNDLDLVLHNSEYFYMFNWTPLKRKNIQTGASLPIPNYSFFNLEMEASLGFLYLRTRQTDFDTFARIDIEAEEFVDFTLEVDSLVEFMSERAGKLYMTGNFTEINNIAHKGLARIDGATGMLDDWTVEGLPDGKMMKIHATEESLYHSIRNKAVDAYELRRIDPETGIPSSWTLPIDAIDVVEVAGRLYVAGPRHMIDFGYTTNFTAYELETCNTELSCNNVNVYLDANGEATLTAAEVGMVTFSNCTIQELVLNQTEFTCDNLGENVVSLTAHTSSGIPISCSAMITVLDTISPALEVQDMEYQIPDEGIIEIVLEDFVVEMYDNCGIASANIAGQTIFTCEDQGQSFNIQIVAIDNSGNEALYPVSVTILASPICCEAEASLASNTATICYGETIAIPLMLSGLPPFQVKIFSNGNTLNHTIDNPATDSIYVTPSETTTYSLISVSDFECLASANGSFEVNVEQVRTAGPDQDFSVCADGDLVSFSDYIHPDANTSAEFLGINGGAATTDLSGTYFLIDYGQVCANDTAEYQFVFIEPGTESNLTIFCDQPNPYFYEVTFEVIGGTPPFTANNGSFTGNVFTSSLISVLDEPEIVFTVSDLIGCEFDVEAEVIDTDGNGVCDEGELVGCMDPTASNYNPLATIPGICSLAATPAPDQLTDQFTDGSGLFGFSQNDNWSDQLQNSWNIKIFPNPGSSDKPINVLFQEFSADITISIQVRDITGRLIQSQEETVQKGNSQSSLNFKETLSQGIYLISFVNEHTQVTKRLVIME